MTDNIAAVRVDPKSVDLTETITRTFPRYLEVHIPVIDEVRYYDTRELSDSTILNGVEHGKSQQLTDSGSGTKPRSPEAFAKVDAREKTLWRPTGTRGSILDVVTYKMWELIRADLKTAGAKSKEMPNVGDFAKYLKTLEDGVEAHYRATAEKQLKTEAAEAKKRADFAAKLVKMPAKEKKE